MKDGLFSACKDCTKKSVTSNRNKNIEHYRAYDRGRGYRNNENYQEGYREENPLKYKATNMVNNAARDGKLFKEPCAECGEADVHAHHDDYAKPLNIRWLCAAHHSQWHRDNGEALNG